MNKQNLEAFWRGFEIGAQKQVESPLWVAAHIYVFILCALQDPMTLFAPALLLPLWAAVYHVILLNGKELKE
jgi:hypothetical protein